MEVYEQLARADGVARQYDSERGRAAPTPMERLTYTYPELSRFRAEVVMAAELLAAVATTADELREWLEDVAALAESGGAGSVDRPKGERR